MAEVVDPARLLDRLTELRGVPRVAVSGGDGTLQTAVAVLRGSSTTLVPVPGGHLNHFARRLGLESPAAAAEAAAADRTRLVPVGVVRAGGREHVFLNTAVVGAYPYVIRLRERMRRFIGVWPAATAAGFLMWARWPRFDLTLRAEGRSLERRTVMLWIGTGAGSFPAPHEAPIADADRLEVVILPSAKRRHALRLFRALWANRRGRAPRSVGLEELRAPAVVIDAHHHLRVTLDAEPVLLTPPVTIGLNPDALRVVCGV